MPQYAARSRRGVAIPPGDLQVPLVEAGVFAEASAGGLTVVTVHLGVAAAGGGGATVTVSPPIDVSASAGGGATVDTTVPIDVSAAAGGGATVTIGMLVAATAGGRATVTIGLLSGVSGGAGTDLISWQTDFPAPAAEDLPPALTDPADFDEPLVLQTTFFMPAPAAFYNGVPVDWEPEVP